MSVTGLVSCVVPVWNGALYLREALDSILAQDYADIEVIVVDDGSTDETPAVIASYGFRIRSVHQANAGPAAARNAGISLARGEFIAFLDSDDLWHPSKTKRQVDRLVARPEVGICVCRLQNFWVPGLESERERSEAPMLSSRISGGFMQAILVRRHVFDRIGLLDPKLQHREAMDWLSRAQRQGVIVDSLNEALVRRRIHFTNGSRNRQGQDRTALLEIVTKALASRKGTDR